MTRVQQKIGTHLWPSKIEFALSFDVISFIDFRLAKQIFKSRGLKGKKNPAAVSAELAPSQALITATQAQDRMNEMQSRLLNRKQ